MCISIVLIVAALMLIILGYSYNQKDGRVEQGGLLKFQSIPSSAMVTLDQRQLGSRTPSNVTADATTHSIQMDLKGYRTWTKTIDLKPGMIGWLSYARLVPTDLKSESVRKSPTLAGALASSDRKWMALLEDASKPTVIVADLGGDEVKYKSLTVPESVVTKPAMTDKPQTFALDSWSRNGQYMLLKHTFDETKQEWIVVDRNDSDKAQNVTALLGISAGKVLFGAENGRTLYARTDNVVRRINLDSQTLSRPLVENIDDFWVYKFDTVLYTTKADDNKQRATGYITEGMEKPTVLRTFPDDGQMIHIAMGEYSNKRHLAIQYGTALVVTSGDLPRGDDRGTMKTVATIALPTAAERLYMWTTGRFVIAESANAYTVHDLELVKTDTTTLKGATASPRPLRWLDPFLTWSDREGALRLYEFDGANQQEIVPVAEGFDVVISPNDKYLYSIGREGDQYMLQRVRMVLN